MKKKEVEVFIGVPCSGKSTYITNTYSKDEVFVISRDDIRNDLIKGTDFSYSELFIKPKDGEKISEKYGYVLPSGNWSVISDLNFEVQNRFISRIEEASEHLSNGKKIVVDLVNLTRPERDNIKEWFKNVEDVEYNAVVFDYERNLELIKSQLLVRSAKEDKFIPFFVVESMIRSAKEHPIGKGEFTNIKFVDGLIGLKENITNESKNQNKPTNKKKRRHP